MTPIVTTELLNTAKLVKASWKALDVLRSSVATQAHALQAQCPHPFLDVTFTEWVGAGFARGACGICCLERTSLDYTKEELDTISFTFKD